MMGHEGYQLFSDLPLRELLAVNQVDQTGLLLHSTWDRPIHQAIP